MNRHHIKTQSQAMEYEPPQTESVKARTSSDTRILLREITTGSGFKRKVSQERISQMSNPISVPGLGGLKPFTVHSQIVKHEFFGRSSQLSPEESVFDKRNGTQMSLQSSQRNYREVQTALWETYNSKMRKNEVSTPLAEKENILKYWSRFRTQLTSLEQTGILAKNSGHLINLLRLLGQDFNQFYESRSQDDEVRTLYAKFLNFTHYNFNSLDEMNDQLRRSKNREHQYEKLIEHLQRQLDESKKKSSQMSSTISPDSKQTKLYQELLNLRMENTRLSKEVETLSDTFKRVDNDSNINSFKEEINNKKQEYEIQLGDLQQKFNKSQKNLSIAQLTLNNLKQNKSTLEAELSTYISQMEKVEGKLKFYETQNHDLTFKVNNYRERMLMQLEDFRLLEQKLEHEKEECTLYKKKLKHLQGKLDRTIVERSTNLSIPENQSYVEDMDMFQNIRAMFKQNSLFFKKIKSTMKGYKHDAIEINQRKLADERMKAKQQPGFKQQRNSDDPQDESFDIYKYAYFKPTFFSLIQQKYMRSAQGTSDQSKDVSCYFIGTMRAILDSKYNEQILNPKYATNFIDFVYAWLGRFKLDHVTRKIDIQARELGDECRVKFYQELSRNSLNKIWEVVTFREFLMDRCANDEIYFYLHYRNLIFQGAQLKHHQSTFQAISYVPWNRIEIVISQALFRFEHDSSSQLKMILRDRCVKKDQNLVIDASLVLRCLLEFYRGERQVRFKLIQDLFHSCSSQDIDGKLHFDFESFKTIFTNNYAEVTEIEKVQLYRDCYSAGGGIVTPEVFFTVATESNFFTSQLRLRGEIYVNHQAQTEQQKETLTRQQIQRDAQQTMSNICQFLEVNQKFYVEFGIESYLDEFFHFQQMTKLHFKTISDQKDTAKIVQILLDTQKQIQSLGLIHILQNMNKLPLDYRLVFVKNIEANIDRLIRDPFATIKNANAKAKFIYEVQIAKVQKAVRIKIQRWYNLLKSELLDKLIQNRIKQIP